MKHFLLLIIAISSIATIAQSAEQPHVLFIMIDDMNDFVEGFGGHPQAETPNIDSLASLGTTFTNGFCNSVLCAPSRMSFMTGTYPETNGILINNPYDCDSLRNNFPEDQTVYTLPEVLKDSGGYYTLSIGKIFHCDRSKVDYEISNPDTCNRGLSWNRVIQSEIGVEISNAGQDNPEGTSEIKWSKIDSALVTEMPDYKSVDSLLVFLDDYTDNPETACNKPLFMALGIRKPHSHLYIPEQYFKDYYIDDFLAEPFTNNFNRPEGSYPYNGLVMPPQPEPLHQDYFDLPELAKIQIALAPHNRFNDWYEELPYYPEIGPGLSTSETEEVLVKSKIANGIMAYLAGIKFVDDMIGRVMDSLANYPEITENLIIVLSSDHGYAWGEKRHYGKSQLWETDTRVPFIIVDMRNQVEQTTNRTASLIDIFPTILDYAEVNPPLYADSSEYLEGKSLRPLIESPNRMWEYPVLTQVRNSVYGNACWPQNSIRNERFHLIQFRSNGAGETDVCDFENSETVNLLYEIGENRNIDPNEWNNLATNPDYDPLVEYLLEFIPAGALYKQKAFTIDIKEKDPACIYNATDKIRLTATIYDEDGNKINNPSELGYQVIWTTNINSLEIENTRMQFNLSGLTESEFNDNDKIIFYVHVYDSLGALKGMNIHYSFINPDYRPNASYDVSLNSFTATITDYTISGVYDFTRWNMGDGNIFDVDIPGPYTYESAGEYNIVHTAYYGNNCKRNFKKTITISEFDEEEIARIGIQVDVFPNPATQFAIVNWSSEISEGQLQVFDAVGQLIYSEYITRTEQSSVLNLSKFSPGLYLIRVRGGGYETVKRLEVLR